MKKLFICFFCFLFSSFTLAKMSDDEARAFIESLAKPSTEKQVFYRWQTEKVRNNLLKSGEMTPELHKHFMSLKGNLAGGGLYVSEDPVSSILSGDTIIKVELDPNYKYLDLTNEDIKAKLKSKGLKIVDVYNLKPRIAIKYDNVFPYWVLKEEVGVKFKDFSPREIKTDHLSKLYLEKKHNSSLQESIKQEISKRLNELYGKNLPENQLENMLKLRLTGDSDLGAFLYKTATDPNEKETILNKSISLIKKPSNGEELLRHVVNPDQRELILNKSISFINTVKGGENLLLHTINNTERELILNKRELILNRDISLIKTVEDGKNLLLWMNSDDVNEISRILKKTIPLITRGFEGASLIENSIPIDSKYKDYILDKSIPLIKTVEDGKSLLMTRNSDDVNEISRILKKTIPLITRGFEGASLIKNLIENKILLDSKYEDYILDKSIPLIKTVEDGKSLFQFARNQKERYFILNKSISLIKTVRQAEDLFLFLSKQVVLLDTEKVKFGIKILELDIDLTPKFLRKYLSSKAYKSLLAEYKKIQTARNKVEKTNRLQCLKQQMLKLVNN